MNYIAKIKLNYGSIIEIKFFEAGTFFDAKDKARNIAISNAGILLEVGFS